MKKSMQILHLHFFSLRGNIFLLRARFFGVEGWGEEGGGGGVFLSPTGSKAKKSNPGPLFKKKEPLTFPPFFSFFILSFLFLFSLSPLFLHFFSIFFFFILPFLSSFVPTPRPRSRIWASILSRPASTNERSLGGANRRRGHHIEFRKRAFPWIHPTPTDGASGGFTFWPTGLSHRAGEIAFGTNGIMIESFARLSEQPRKNLPRIVTR